MPFNSATCFQIANFILTQCNKSFTCNREKTWEQETPIGFYTVQILPEKKQTVISFRSQATIMQVSIWRKRYLQKNVPVDV